MGNLCLLNSLFKSWVYLEFCDERLILYCNGSTDNSKEYQFADVFFEGIMLGHNIYLVKKNVNIYSVVKSVKKYFLV